MNKQKYTFKIIISGVINNNFEVTCYTEKQAKSYIFKTNSTLKLLYNNDKIDILIYKIPWWKQFIEDNKIHELKMQS